MTQPRYSIIKNEERHIWFVARLWKLSSGLAPFDYCISDFEGFDHDCWYCGANIPTIRSVLEHMQRIESADLDKPIILSQSGAVMHGVHRICKASLKGLATLPAVQFAIDPKPDLIEPL